MYIIFFDFRDLDKMKDGIGEKLGIFTYLMVSFISSIIISFIYGWKLTLVVLSCAPVIVIATAVVAKVQASLSALELAAYGQAGSVAEEVLGAVRTVIAFNGEQKEVGRYAQKLVPAEKTGIKRGLWSGVGGGVMWFIIYLSYALAFWYGVQLIWEDRPNIDKEYTPAVLVIVFFGVLAGAQNMGLTSPHLEAFAVARGSAAAIFQVRFLFQVTFETFNLFFLILLLPHTGRFSNYVNIQIYFFRIFLYNCTPRTHDILEEL